jgi:hypothetical protein
MSLAVPVLALIVIVLNMDNAHPEYAWIAWRASLFLSSLFLIFILLVADGAFPVFFLLNLKEHRSE